MRQRAIGWMILCFVLALAPAAWSAEPPAATPPAPDAGALPGSSCEAASSNPFLFYVDNTGLDPASTARPMANACCAAGCCTLISSGCEACPQGGRRWYDKYSCPGGGTCKIVPGSCPTAC
jgi:hypothetical protein